MKKYLVATAVAGTLLTTGAFAYGSNHSDCDKQTSRNKMEKRSHHQRGNHKMPIMKALRSLKLTDAQKEQIQTIMEENFKDKKKMSSFFENDSFDKAKYEKFLQEKRDKSIKQRAKTIEKVYNILTHEQKVEFKKSLQDREAHMEKRLKDRW